MQRERTQAIRNAIFCALTFSACFWISWPVAQMGFIDDWSYIKSAQVFAQTGHIVYNGWAAMILGWQIPWGALFIRLFGFSFMAVKLSTFPLAAASVFLFYLIQARFGIRPRNAVIGTLTLGLSPLFLPLAASFMSDVPALFVILLCIYLCQRAIAARTSTATIAWLSLAAATNVAGGTVRQIVWLGALVMVPATAWFLRKRRGVILAALVLWAGTIAGVLYFMHWFARQPYAISLPIILHSHYTYMAGAIFHASVEALCLFLCLILVIYPVLIPWFTGIRGLSRSTMAKLALLFLLWWLVEWAANFPLPFIFQAMTTKLTVLKQEPSYVLDRFFLSDPIRFVVAPLLVVTLIIFGLAIRSRISGCRRLLRDASWREMIWMLGPFLVSYCILLISLTWSIRAIDRYMLDLMPVAIIFLIRAYQDLVAPDLTVSSMAAVAVLALLAVAGTHDWFARQRARLAAINEIRASGVPRTEIQGGFEYDGWTQIEKDGHINQSEIKIPRGAYQPNPPVPQVAVPCSFGFAPDTPAIHPIYTVAFPQPMSCFSVSEYAPVHFRTWLPPFRGIIYVQGILKAARTGNAQPVSAASQWNTE